jgi:hypothetical protein
MVKLRCMTKAQQISAVQRHAQIMIIHCVPWRCQPRLKARADNGRTGLELVGRRQPTSIPTFRSPGSKINYCTQAFLSQHYLLPLTFCASVVLNFLSIAFFYACNCNLGNTSLDR